MNHASCVLIRSIVGEFRGTARLRCVDMGSGRGAAYDAGVAVVAA